MGKSKSRILRKGINDLLPKVSRQEAVQNVVKSLENNDIKEAANYITLFGMTPEEVLEAGASYETVIAMKNFFE